MSENWTCGCDNFWLCSLSSMELKGSSCSLRLSSGIATKYLDAKAEWEGRMTCILLYVDDLPVAMTEITRVATTEQNLQNK